MATTATLVTVKDRLVTLYRAALATASPTGGQVQVEYAWPGAKTEPEAVFLGRHPDLAPNPLAGLTRRTEIPNSQAGRKQRQESYPIEVTLWSFRPDLSAKDARTAEARTFTLLGLIEDVHANQSHLGIRDTIQKAELAETEVALLPHEKGWASVVVLTINVEARLS